MRYFNGEIPQMMALNFILLNRISGSSDEMDSLINALNRSWTDMEAMYEKIIENKNNELIKFKDEIEKAAGIEENDKKNILASFDNIFMRDELANLTKRLNSPFEKFEE
jgi:hypothetical protein